MAFWNDFVEGVKDVGTSATRIVTDTAIDLGDVATGFQFSDDMKAAKKAMSDAGVLSAADAIEKNHYPFLKRNQAEAERKLLEVQKLFREGQAQEKSAEAAGQTLAGMCADVVNLAAECEEGKRLMAEARRIPDWERWSSVLDVPPDFLADIDTLDASVAAWETVGRRLATAGLVSGTSDGLTALASIAALSKGKKLTRLAKLGRAGMSAGAKGGGKVAGALAKGTKFIKVGKMAGRASGVLAVVTVGLDVGLSVVELETRKSQLEATLEELDASLIATRRDLGVLQAENAVLRERIAELLGSVSPPQSEGSWDQWVEATRARLRTITGRLTSIAGIVERAERQAEQSRDEPFPLRVQLVVAVDPGISPDEAREIILRVDLAAGREDGSAERQGEAGPAGTTVAALPWRSEGPGTHRVAAGKRGDDAIALSYGVDVADATSSWHAQTTAPRTRVLSVRWRYGASHTPGALPGRLALFSDGPDGRRQVTLHAGAPAAMSDPEEGRASLQVHRGERFGVALSIGAAREASGGIRRLLGTYRRTPIENDWHEGSIDVEDGSELTLKWTNRAGVSWALMPRLADGVLLKLPGSPYQDEYPGSNAFTLVERDGVLLGFDFIGERYERRLDEPPAPSAATGEGGLCMGLVELDFRA